MKYYNFTMIVLFSGCEEAKILDVVAIDKNAALGDITNAYGETPDLLGFTQGSEV